MKKFLVFLSLLFVTSTANCADYYSVGVDCYKKGYIDKALHNFEQTVKITPNNVNARYYLAQCYLLKGRSDDAKNQYARILILAPSSTAAKLASKGLNLIKENSVEKKYSTPENIDSYIKACYIDGKIYRWKKTTLTVYIPYSSNRSIVQNGFSQWSYRTNGKIKFIYVANPTEAQIIVTFKDILNKSEHESHYNSGLASTTLRGDNITHANIKILNSDDSNVVFYTAMHEMGHALGIANHSENVDDVMYPQTQNTQKQLSKRDVNTVLLIYR